jgi:hypothetical protein
MEYRCRFEKLDKLRSINHEEISLCSNCKSYDCSNPIENMTISVLGINREIRVFVTANSVYGVKQCEGYSTSSSVDSEEDEDD